MHFFYAGVFTLVDLSKGEFVTIQVILHLLCGKNLTVERARYVLSRKKACVALSVALLNSLILIQESILLC